MVCWKLELSHVKKKKKTDEAGDTESFNSDILASESLLTPRGYGLSTPIPED